MSSSTLPSLVLVTGANGFIGASLVQTLLEEGYKVRGTVRDASNEAKTASLKAMKNADTNLELVSLDLSGPEEDFQKAVKDVEWIFHVASPVTLDNVKDEEKTIIGPAKNGVLGMLHAANNEPTVHKFIYTSSVAAIIPGHTDDGKPLTEEIWADLEGPYVNAYDKSKTRAEQAAWDFMKGNNPKFTLSAINPVFVLGPIPTPNAKTSTEMVARPLRGADPGTIDVYCPLVDIRDVVKAHIQAAKLPEAAGKRFILCQTDGGEIFLPDICLILDKEFGPMGYNIATRKMPDWLVWLISWFDKDLAAMYPFLGKEYHYDNSRSREILKIEYIPAEQTILDCGYSLIEHGVIPKKPSFKSPS